MLIGNNNVYIIVISDFVVITVNYCRLFHSHYTRNTTLYTYWTINKYDYNTYIHGYIDIQIVYNIASMGNVCLCTSVS